MDAVTKSSSLNSTDEIPPFNISDKFTIFSGRNLIKLVLHNLQIICVITTSYMYTLILNTNTVCPTQFEYS